MYCSHCKKDVGAFGCFLAICPVKHVVKDIQPISGAEKVKRLIDKDDITMDDIIQYINDDPKGHYQVIDLWEDD